MADLRTGLRAVLQKTGLWKPVNFCIQCLSCVLYKFVKVKLFEVDQQSYWSERSSTPGTDAQKNDSYYRRYDATILDEIGQLRVCKTILEVGCFTGKMVSLVHDRYPEKTITGCDLGREQIVSFRHSRASGDIDLIQCNAAYLPFKDNSFDLVFTSTCLQHVPDKIIEQAIHELSRVGKTHILLAECYIHHLSAGKKFELLSSNYYYMHDYEKLLNSCPFEKVKVHGIPDDSGINRYSIFVYQKKMRHNHGKTCVTWRETGPQ